MATPITAGAALLVRQYFAEGWYPTGAAVAGNALNASGPLIKAVLIGVTLIYKMGYCMHIEMCKGEGTFRVHFGCGDSYSSSWDSHKYQHIIVYRLCVPRG